MTPDARQRLIGNIVNYEIGAQEIQERQIQHFLKADGYGRG